MKNNLRTTIFQLACLFSIATTSFGGFQITDLGTLGGTESFAYAINDAGQVVGLSRLAGDNDTHAFLYDHGNLIDLSVTYNLGSGPYGESVSDINNSGQIVGNSPGGHVMILSGGSVTEIGVFDGMPSSFSAALGINNLAQVVGYYSSADSLHHAFLYSNGVVTTIGPFGADATSVAYAINDSGMVAGSAADSFMVPAHAFLYSNGVMTDISPFGNSESTARAINNSGQVVGEFLTADNSSFHAFLYSNGVFTDLGFEGSPLSVPFAINDSGQVVGTVYVNYNVCYDPGTGKDYPCPANPHAFFYDHGRIIDLNVLMHQAGIFGWKLTIASDINNKGQIVGYGVRAGKYRAFLIEPL